MDAATLKLASYNDSNPDVVKMKFEFNQEDARVLDETCPKYMEKVPAEDRAKRAMLLGQLVDLMVYDLQQE